MGRVRVFCVLLALVTAVGAAPGAAAQDNSAPAASIEDLQQRIEALLRRHNVAGAGIGLATRDGFAWSGGFGVADRSNGAPVTASTHFRAGSVSKTFIAIALVQLARQGKLDLDAPLRQIAPEVPYTNAWESSHPVRIAHLLEHTAGFDDMRFNEFYNIRHRPDLPLMEALQLNPRSRVTRWAPGTRVSYSNPGYAIAGYVLEKLTGRGYAEAVRNLVFEPLGMNTSRFAAAPSDDPALTAGYDGRARAASRPIYSRPAGSLQTSAEEMTRFVEMLLRGGTTHTGERLLEEQDLLRMERPATSNAARAGLEHGYGLGMFADVEGKTILFGHDGGIEGFTSYYGYSREHGIGGVVLLNAENARPAIRAIVRESVSFLLRNQTPSSPPPATSRPDLDQYTGYYADEAPRNEVLRFLAYLLGGITLSAGPDGLVEEHWLEEPRPLIPAGPGKFRLESDLAASRILFNDPLLAVPVYASAMSYHVRTSPWPHRLVLAVLTLCILLFLSTPVYGAIWFWRWLRGRQRPLGFITLRVIPLIIVGCFATLALLIAFADPSRLGVRNTVSVTLWLMTLLAPLFSVAGIVFWIGPGRQAPAWLRFHSLAVSLAGLAVCLYLGYWGLIGFRTWDY